MSMFPIASSTVGAGGVSSVTFSSIPQTFTHLQLRVSAQTNRATYGNDQLFYTVNSDTGTNYTIHTIVGNGAVPAAYSGTNAGFLDFGYTAGTAVSNVFGAAIIDCLDYTNTNKNKTFRAIGGEDINGTIAGFGGDVCFGSAVWRNTAAITSITVRPNGGTLFNQYTRLDLYGITTSNATGA